jgi:hypothetical protein
MTGCFELPGAGQVGEFYHVVVLGDRAALEARLNGFLVKTPANIMAQLPTTPTISFTVDKCTPKEPDR